MEREALSSNTEYQKRLIEARIKGAFQGREQKVRLRLNKLDYEHRQLQQQVSIRSTCMCSELFPSLAITSYLLHWLLFY